MKNRYKAKQRTIEGLSRMAQTPKITDVMEMWDSKKPTPENISNQN